MMRRLTIPTPDPRADGPDPAVRAVGPDPAVLAVVPVPLGTVSAPPPARPFPPGPPPPARPRVDLNAAATVWRAAEAEVAELGKYLAEADLAADVVAKVAGLAALVGRVPGADVPDAAALAAGVAGGRVILAHAITATADAMVAFVRRLRADPADLLARLDRLAGVAAARAIAAGTPDLRAAASEAYRRAGRGDLPDLSGLADGFMAAYRAAAA